MKKKIIAAALAAGALVGLAAPASASDVSGTFYGFARSSYCGFGTDHHLTYSERYLYSSVYHGREGHFVQRYDYLSAVTRNEFAFCYAV